MANKRIEMRKVRELLRLCIEQDISVRQAAKILGIGKTAASEYISGFRKSKLSFKQSLELSDSDLLNIINIKRDSVNQRYQELSSQFSHFQKELKRPGVTKQLLWQEYKENKKDYFGYSQFCHHYAQWQKQQKVSMRMEHKAGDKLFVDFTGKKLSTICPKTGEVIEYEVFVAVLGASQLSYIEAVPSQKKPDWIAVNESCLRFFGGVPSAIVPDCLKSAVTKSDRYEPEINQTYLDFAEHYNTVILPARALHPQDKSLAENFVLNAYRHIYAPLRNCTFHSPEELNTALWKELDKFNNRKFQKRDCSRRELFNEIEKSELKPLTSLHYQLKTFAQIRVQYNHHIYLKEDQHYYSVPAHLTGKRLRVCYTNDTLEIYHNNIRVAMHMRNRRAYGYSTKEEHRPDKHKYISQWNAARYIAWGNKISPETGQFIEAVLNSRKHPEQAFKSCMGILNLSKSYSDDDFSKACKKALKLEVYTHRFVKNTLINKTFNLEEEEESNPYRIPEHENIRGKQMYN